MAFLTMGFRGTAWFGGRLGSRRIATRAGERSPIRRPPACRVHRYAAHLVSVTLVLSLVSACLAPAGERGSGETVAVAAVQKLGGTIETAEGVPGSPAISIDFGWADVTDADLVHLRDLPDLESLRLYHGRITDAGLCAHRGPFAPRNAGT